MILILTLVILVSASYFRYESLPNIPHLKDVIVLRGKILTVAEGAFEVARPKIRRIFARLWMREGRKALKKNPSFALALLERAYEVESNVWPFKRD